MAELLRENIDDIIELSDNPEAIHKTELINNSRHSYITKENFIKIISELTFDRIESVNIHFITGYEYIPENEKTREHVKTFGYDLNIS